MDELKPCPFCRKPPITSPSGEGGKGLMIECLTEGCVNPHTSYYDHASAIRVWNTRAASGGDSEWQPIETAPDDGTPILIATIEGGILFDLLHGHFEVLAEDEEDGPWDIRGGEPWCSYVGREAGIYFCYWLPGKEWETRWKFGPNTGYTHWMPAPLPNTEVTHD